MKQLLITPHLSEKAVSEAAKGTYIFNVPVQASKNEIIQNLVQQYSVTPVDVRVLNRKGKRTRTHRGGGKFVSGRRADAKKAYVRLKEGQSIPIFEETT